MREPTLNRFFSLHFFIPLALTLFVGTHIVFLHETGSNNPLGVSSNLFKIPFYPYFILKDVRFLFGVAILFMALLFFSPWALNDPENFIPANPLNTPLHIQPEWYFLFLYAILRSIPNKLLGVVLMGLALLILPLTPVIFKPKIYTAALNFPLKL